MNLGKLFSPKFYIPKMEKYNELISFDYKFNKAFRGGSLNKKFVNSVEWKFIKCYRKLQSNTDNIWQYVYRWKLDRLEMKTGISLEGNMSIGKGLIIGHRGTIVINGGARFGSELFITHGVTVGRDVRGKRAGVPIFGDKVCIRANSTVVGNITIGSDVLIAPNTFVNFDVPDHSIVVGNPATIHSRENATVGHIPDIDL